MQRRVGVIVRASRLATTALVTPQRHTRAGGAGDQRPIGVESIAFDQARRAAGLDHAADGLPPGLPHGFQEVDLELEGGARFPLSQCAGIRHAHSRIGNIAEHATVERSHGIGVLCASLTRYGATRARPRAESPTGETHRMDDCLDHGTALLEGSSPVGLFSGETPVLGTSRCGWNKHTQINSTYYKKYSQCFLR